MEKEDVRKGPWTEQEDVQLVFYVKLFGDRRWDFVAKVSGLKRTGKSCRLRWVNYLHPDLKRGKMTPREEKLVLELHAKYGNRWSRIARKLPGRTDNEIKNYWRTYKRKTAREKKATVASPTPSSSSSNSSLSSVSHSPIEDCENPIEEINECSFYDTGGKNNTFMASNTPEKNKTVNGLEKVQDSAKVYSMDEIWKDIELSEGNNIDFTGQVILTPPSPIWDFNPVATDSLWCMNEEEQSKMLMNQQQAMNYDQFSFYNPFY